MLEFEENEIPFKVLLFWSFLLFLTPKLIDIDGRRAFCYAWVIYERFCTRMKDIPQNRLTLERIV